jgi:hypothetical protein
MSDPIRLTIRAQNAETDAPTVEDLLAQISDWNSILRGVKEAIARSPDTSACPDSAATEPVSYKEGNKP